MSASWLDFFVMGGLIRLCLATSPFYFLVFLLIRHHACSFALFDFLIQVSHNSPAKIPKTEKSNLHVFELHRPSSKGTKSLFHVIKATIKQKSTLDSKWEFQASA